MKFFSKHPSYQILYRPEQRQYAPDGNKIVLEGIKYINFANCLYETNDVDECVYLLRSSAYGKDIYSDIQISEIMDGTWLEKLKKLLVIPVAPPDFEIEKLKKDLGQLTTPKIQTHENKAEQAVIENVKLSPNALKA